MSSNRQTCCCSVSCADIQSMVNRYFDNPSTHPPKMVAKVSGMPMGELTDWTTYMWNHLTLATSKAIRTIYGREQGTIDYSIEHNVNFFCYTSSPRFRFSVGALSYLSGTLQHVAAQNWFAQTDDVSIIGTAENFHLHADVNLSYNGGSVLKNFTFQPGLPFRCIEPSTIVMPRMWAWTNIYPLDCNNWVAFCDANGENCSGSIGWPPYNPTQIPVNSQVRLQLCLVCGSEAGAEAGKVPPGFDFFSFANFQ